MNLLALSIYMIALVNPISKVFILSTMPEDMSDRQLRSLVIRSSLVGLTLLVGFSVLGNFVLDRIFHVEIYSFQMVGGLMLFFVGYKALSKGTFFEEDTRRALSELSIVPLACPLIAGPATLTAALSFPKQHGYAVFMAAMGMALSVNLVMMLLSRPIGHALRKYNLMGALIRITGMIVATIAVQMVLQGISDWQASLGQVAG